MKSKYGGSLAALAALAILLPISSRALADNQVAVHDGADNVSSFKQALESGFNNWDLDKNGVLDDNEIDSCIQDPSIKGKSAAALSAIKVYRRSHSHLQPFQISDLSPVEQDPALSKQHKDLVSLYGRLFKRISGDPPVLFARGVPHIDGIKQGNTGDCYLLSTVAGLAYHDPQRLAALIVPNRDGSYTVNFPQHEPITVAPPTDCEIASYTDDAQDGYWLHVIEKAWGVYRDRKRTHTEVVDSVIHGGSGGGAIMFVTGNACVRYPTSATDISEIRAQLVEAMQNKRVVNTGTPTHCLTVLNYDPAVDTITIWNPWGSSKFYKPANQVMKNGVFTMGLSEFMQNFVSILVEKDRPATPEDYSKLKKSKKLHP